jgi:hypothetical protein
MTNPEPNRQAVLQREFKALTVKFSEVMRIKGNEGVVHGIQTDQLSRQGTEDSKEGR